MASLKFKIYRYDPDKDEKPYMQDIEVENDENHLTSATTITPANTQVTSTGPRRPKKLVKPRTRRP